MKKGLRNIIILACICAVLGAGYFTITATENPAQAGVLYKLGSDKIRRVDIVNQYGGFVFERQSSAWVVESGGVYRTNPEKINLLLSCLEDFKIIRMLAEEKSEYGFDMPQAKICVTTDSGKEYSFIVGADSVNGSSVYIKSNGQIMLASTGMTSQFTGSLAAYRAKDVLMVDPANIRSIDYYVNGEKTISLANSDYQTWTIRYPFDAPARRVIMNELVARLRSLKIVEYVDNKSTKEKTGLDGPAGKMVLTDQAGIRQTLEFGAVNGNLEYVRIGTENDIVKLYASDLDFSGLTPQGVMFIAPLNIDISKVKSLSIQADGTTDTFNLEHNSDIINVKFNGTEIPYSAFATIYFKYISLNADGYDKETAVPGKCKAVCTTTLQSGEKVELSLLERDTDTLYMLLNGQTKFYMQKSYLTELIYRLQNLKKD